MQRREFLALSGMGLAGLVLPHGRLIAAEQLLEPGDPVRNRVLAEAALGAAKRAGATYCDVRIGRYLNQAVITRERTVQNVTNSESAGIGIRVIVNGAWGFAATHQRTPAAVLATVGQAAAIARANAGIQTRPVQLAPVTGVGEVSWKTPIRRNAMAVPIQDKVEMLLAVNAAALDAGADFINSTLFLVNEQKYFASSDGSFIDQDVHRI
ncbi:DNA gyrase modulator, partial [Stenotrophomonas sp.]